MVWKRLDELWGKVYGLEHLVNMLKILVKIFFKGWFLNQEVASESPWSFFKMHMPLRPSRPSGPPGAERWQVYFQQVPRGFWCTLPLPLIRCLKVDIQITQRADYSWWCSGSGVEPESLYFLPAPRWCPGYLHREGIEYWVRCAVCLVLIYFIWKR